MIQEYDERRLGRTPLGAVREQEGALVRLHHGTHVTIEHAGAITDDLRSLVERQQSVAAERKEPVEWRIHRHLASHGLADQLAQSGFSEDEPTYVMIAARDRALATDQLPDNVHCLIDDAEIEEVLLATAAAQRVWQDEDGVVTWYVLRRGQELTGVLWWHAVVSDKFIEFGMTGAYEEFGPLLQAVAPRWPFHERHLLVAGNREVRDLAARQGFRGLTSIRTFRWTPEGKHVMAPPIRPGGVECSDLVKRFTRRFEFNASMHHFPGITEPEDSVTWSNVLDAAEDVAPAIRRALKACVKPGELIFFADPYHLGSAADLHRVDGPGQPRWHASPIADGDYAILAPYDLRFGTFGHPWEDSLCVWGEELLAEVSDELDALMPRLRTGGKKK
ncbi:DUF2716 domain-containing protein [Lentzea sp. NPDC092896]|uniref:DUF2716 domain-containing protein n=1 Tax=Lentzea sp. NPDC092896 TaxID=3364127 RepID=UPI0037FFE818